MLPTWNIYLTKLTPDWWLLTPSFQKPHKMALSIFSLHHQWRQGRGNISLTHMINDHPECSVVRDWKCCHTHQRDLSPWSLDFEFAGPVCISCGCGIQRMPVDSTSADHEHIMRASGPRVKLGRGWYSYLGVTGRPVHIHTSASRIALLHRCFNCEAIEQSWR